MVCEKLVIILSSHQSSYLSHFLCTHPSLQGRGYTKRIIKVVFFQGEMMNKKMYAVTRLPCGYTTTNIWDDEIEKSMKKTKHYDGWNTPFWEQMNSTRYKNSYKDVVDECDDLIHGSSITFNGNATSVRFTKENPSTSLLYELDSHTKYSIAVKIEDNLMYSKNPDFGWLKCNFQTLEDLLSKKQAARDNMGKEVMLNVGGRRKTF